MRFLQFINSLKAKVIETNYYYMYNAQGDVIGLYNNAGNVVCRYYYDAWGKLLQITDGVGNEKTYDTSFIGYKNPIRYRAYYYDNETGMYYLQSRYYNPEFKRFISADDIQVVGTTPSSNSNKNLFNYCDNNPVVRSDSTGAWFGLDDLVASACGAIVGGVGQLVSDVVTSVSTGSVSFSNWQTYTGAIVGGIAGAETMLYTGNPVLAGAVSGGLTTGVGCSLEKLTIKNYDKSWAEIGVNTLVDTGVGAFLSKVPGVKGISSGRNSYQAVYKSGLTKLKNGTAQRMSAKVFSKGMAAYSISSVPMDYYYGMKQTTYSHVKKCFESYYNTERYQDPCYRMYLLSLC